MTTLWLARKCFKHKTLNEMPSTFTADKRDFEGSNGVDTRKIEKNIKSRIFMFFEANDSDDII